MVRTPPLDCHSQSRNFEQTNRNLPDTKQATTDAEVDMPATATDIMSTEQDCLDKMAEGHKQNKAMITEINKLVFSLLPAVPPDSHILDFGCGAGRISLLLGALETVASVVGTDVSMGMLDQASDLLQAEPNPKVSFQLTSRLAQKELEAWKGTKDLVVMSLVLGHIHPKEDGQGVVATVASTLKKGGKLALAEFLFVEGDEGGGHFKSESHAHSHSHDHSHSHNHGHGHNHGDGHKSHEGGHMAFTEEEIRRLFAKCDLEPAAQFTPFEFDMDGVSRKCIMAIGTKL